MEKLITWMYRLIVAGAMVYIIIMSQQGGIPVNTDLREIQSLLEKIEENTKDIKVDVYINYEE